MTGDSHWDQAEEGIELLQSGDPEGAIDELLRVIKVHTSNEYAHLFLGHAYFEKKAYAQALKCYVRALHVIPEYLGAMVGAGQALRMMGQYDKAIQMGKRILAKEPDDADALYILGAAHFQRGDNSASRGYLERFLQTGPELEVALEVEGMLQTIRGEVFPFPGVEDSSPN